MRKGTGVRLVLALVAIATLLILATPVALVAQGTAVPSAPSRGIELGVTGGLVLPPGIQALPTIGVSAGVSLSDLVSLKFGYSHAGISLLGTELASIDFFDLAILLETSWREPFGIYGFGGGSHVLAGALGESIGGAVLLGGLGIRLSPADFMNIRLGYVARVRNGVIHVVEAGISFRF